MSTHLCDTQIVSYAINGHRSLPSSDVAISSITAQELLLVQGGEFTRNNYYVPFIANPPTEPGSVEAILRERGRFRKGFGKNATDRFILDFGASHPQIIEYSHLAIARALNSKDYYLLYGLVSLLSKTQRRAAVRRLRFLMDKDIRCIPLRVQDAEVGLKLFRSFTENYTVKQRFRNSLNDILTLAVAQVTCSLLHTNDELLATFASNHSGVPVNRQDESLIVDFTQAKVKNRANRGSKGYVNYDYNWRVRW